MPDKSVGPLDEAASNPRLMRALKHGLAAVISFVMRV